MNTHKNAFKINQIDKSHNLKTPETLLEKLCADWATQKGSKTQSTILGSTSFVTVDYHFGGQIVHAYLAVDRGVCTALVPNLGRLIGDDTDLPVLVMLAALNYSSYLHHYGVDTSDGEVRLIASVPVTSDGLSQETINTLLLTVEGGLNEYEIALNG